MIKIIKRLITLSVHSLFVLVLMFIINLAFNKDWNGFPGKAKVKKTRPNTRRTKTMEEKWYKTEDRKPPYDVPIVAELEGCVVFRYVKKKLKKDDEIGHIKRWRYLTLEEIKLENQVSAYKKQGKKINLW